MIGYCETCTQVVDSVDEAHGADVCPNCGDDVHPGFHVEDDEVVDDYIADEMAFDQWLLNG